jgi:hypothetical protein
MTVQLRNPLASFVPKSGEVVQFVQSYSWVASQRQVVQLPTGLDFDSIIVKVAGTFTLSSAATTVNDLAPAQLINSIQWKGDTTKQLEDTNGVLAAWGNFERDLSRDIVAPGVGATTHTVRVSMRLDRVTPKTRRPKDSALHTSQPYLGSHFLTIDAGTIQACYSNFGTGAISATAITVSIYAVQIQEGQELGMTEARWIRKHTLYTITTSSANAALTQTLLTNTYMRGVKLFAFNSSGVSSAGLVNNVRIRSGANIRMDIDEASLRAKNLGDFNLQATQLSAVPGLMFADLLENKRLNTLWDLWNASECVLELNLSANVTVYAQLITYDKQPGVMTAQRAQLMKAQGALAQARNRIVGAALGRK